jgi:hypothetical protein
MKQSDLGKSLDPNVQSTEKRLTQTARRRIIVEGDLSLVLGARSQTLCKKFILQKNIIIMLNAKVCCVVYVCEYSLFLSLSPGKILWPRDQNYYKGISMENINHNNPPSQNSESIEISFRNYFRLKQLQREGSLLHF